MTSPVASPRREPAPTTRSAKTSDSRIPPGLLTIDETAEFLSVSRRTIQTYMESGELTVTRFGRSVRIDPVDVAAFIAAHKDGNGKAPRARRSSKH